MNGAGLRTCEDFLLSGFLNRTLGDDDEGALELFIDFVALSDEGT